MLNNAGQRLKEYLPQFLQGIKKVPKRLEIGDAASEQQFSSVEDHYRAIYFEAIDTVIGTIKNRFDQEGFKMLQKLEAVLFSGLATSQR